MIAETGPEVAKAALKFAARGLRILPVHGIVDGVCTCPEKGSCGTPGKHPRIRAWQDNATTDSATIRDWWKRWPDANVGIASGANSGIVVFDVDSAAGGEESLDALIAEHGPLPPTPEVLTGGGGRHLYFRHPGGQNPNSVGRLGPGLDMRGDGGFAVAPPSLHVSGRRYAWEASGHIEDVPLAVGPSWIVGDGEAETDKGQRNEPGWVSVALRGVKKGERNHTASKLAGYYLRRGLSGGDVAVLLKSTFAPNCTPSVDPEEIDHVVASIVRTRSRADDFRRGGTAEPKESVVPNRSVEAHTSKGGAPDIDSPPVPRRPAEFPLTDAGNAELVAYLFSDRLRFDHQRRRWLAWKGHRWVEDPDGEPVRLALDATRVRYRDAEHINDTEERKRAAKWSIGSEARQKLDAALHLAKNLPPIADAGANWDADPFLLGCENGVIDLRTGRLNPGRPEDRITMSTGVNFDPDAPAPRWERFLGEVFDDVELADYIQRASGYSATGDISEQSIFVGYGRGANGKSTFFNALRMALGDYAHNAPFSAFETRRGNSIPTDVADLVDRRFVTASETGESSRLNEARIKALSGGDPQTARHLYGRFFTFEPTGKIWLGVNHRPIVRDDSHGFWRRVRLIPFNRQFDGESADPHVIDVLRDEREGILAWLVAGALRWQDFGLHPPPCVESATEEYREDSDPLADFLTEVPGVTKRCSPDSFQRPTWGGDCLPCRGFFVPDGMHCVAEEDG